MSRSFFNSRAAVWDATVAESDTSKLQRMAHRLHIPPGARILDVGTGTGVFLPYLVDMIGDEGRVVALDLAEEMLKVALAKSPDGAIHYVQATASDLPLPGEQFDAVVCYSSFPHLQPLGESLRELHRVLRSGGRVLICHTSSRARINDIHRTIDAVSDHLIPDERDMERILSAAGFRDIRISDREDSYLATATKS
jgi:ubiquinone/menaquinone biosynthesis C-methylase UbiE